MTNSNFLSGTNLNGDQNKALLERCINKIKEQLGPTVSQFSQEE